MDQASRRLLHRQAGKVLVAEAADVLMDRLPPAGWSDLARRRDVEHSTALLRAEMQTLLADLQAAITTQTRWMMLTAIFR